MTSAPAPPATSFEPVPDGSVTSPRGFTAAAAHAGLKTDGALDVALLVSATSCATAGVFTKNAVRAAPVIYAADLLSERPGRIRAIAMNARVANACTGPEGLAAARAMAQAAEQAAGLPPRTALVLSTGVIGVPLPVAPIAEGLRAAAAHLTAAGGTAAARAIMTTDTRPKHCAVRFETPGGIVTVGGTAKGPGRLHPAVANRPADPSGWRSRAAAGAAGVALAVERLTLEASVNGEWLTLAQGGATAHPDPERAHAIFRQKTIRLRIDLGLGRAEAVVWTCDLTPDYVRINADYTS